MKLTQQNLIASKSLANHQCTHITSQTAASFPPSAVPLLTSILRRVFQVSHIYKFSLSKIHSQSGKGLDLLATNRLVSD